MKKVIIGVHGLGNKPPKLAEILSEFIGDHEIKIARNVKNKVRNMIDIIKMQGYKIKDKLNID